MRVLVIEDEKVMALQVGESLRKAGFATDVVFDGEEGHFLGDTEPHDVVVLDLGLPKMAGLKILEQWRGDGRIMPVLIVSARDTWREKVTGLRAGADDYLAYRAVYIVNFGDDVYVLHCFKKKSKKGKKAPKEDIALIKKRLKKS